MSTTPTTASRGVAREVRNRIQRGGERVWAYEDFADLPWGAVARVLSRMAGPEGLQRLSKGVYYRSRPTPFGPSLPSAAAVSQLAGRAAPVFPSGVAAANRLGLTTQTPARGELATTATSLPRKLVGEKTVVHARRPAAWASLSQDDAALLDVLRQRGRSSELSPQDTITRTLQLLAEADRFRRLAKVALTEPPRVRAMLGALGEELGTHPEELLLLRSTLNPLSRFDFGSFTGLPHARAWQAKGPK